MIILLADLHHILLLIIFMNRLQRQAFSYLGRSPCWISTCTFIQHGRRCEIPEIPGVMCTVEIYSFHRTSPMCCGNSKINLYRFLLFLPVYSEVKLVFIRVQPLLLGLLPVYTGQFCVCVAMKTCC